MTTKSDEIIIVHAINEKFKAICGFDWEYGRTVKDFRYPIINFYPVEMKKCDKCMEIITKGKDK